MIANWLKRNNKGSTELVRQIEPPGIQGIIPVKSVDDLLKKHSGHIAQINELAGLSKQNFDRFYLAAIHQFARFVQQCPASEVHHHAGLGGMLAHALEVCVIALKIRRSYLLSETGGAEEISQKQDLWTYAVFVAALCHDLAKVAVDQTLTLYDQNHHQQQWDPWNKYIDEQGVWYTTEFVRDRQYRLHEKASPVLVYKIIPSQGMKWICSDQAIFARWLACLSGDMDNASSIGEIISIADGKSVGSNLGADNSRMPTVKTKPLHEKMLTALRHLLMEGELPLNRNGAAGWTLGDDCWLVSKRTVDAIREQLTQEGHTGIPTKNGRLFDILQEHGVIIPYGDKAIWSATIKGDGWSNDLTLIKVATHTIWANPAHRPNDFEGQIIVTESHGKASGSKRNEENRPEKKENGKSGKETPVQPVENKEPPKKTTDSFIQPITDSVKKDKITSLEPLEQDMTDSLAVDEAELMAFLPSFHSEDEKDFSDADETKDNSTDSMELKTTDSEELTENILTDTKESNTFTLTANRKKQSLDNQDQVVQFFDWLQAGIEKGNLKTNQSKARIHIVQEGVILITPGIFQDFANTKNDALYKWNTLQQKVLKKNWHERDNKGLNVVKYAVKGKNKKTTVNAILFQDTSIVFGSQEQPKSNPHLIKVD